MAPNKMSRIFKKIRYRDYLWLIPAGIFIVWLFASGMSGIIRRINETGWQHFPATLLDWLAIVGSLMFCGLAVYGSYRLVKHLSNR